MSWMVGKMVCYKEGRIFQEGKDSPVKNIDECGSQNARLSFSRPNYGSSRPLARKRVLPSPQLVPWGEDTLACGREGGGSQFGRRDRHTGTLGIALSLYDVFYPD